MDRCSVTDKIFNWNVLVTLCSGQLLSLLICGTAVTSGILGERGVNIPTAQSFLNYVLLCIVYTSILAYRRENGIFTTLKQRGWKYFILAAVDVEGNYLIVKAYHYTTVTSVQLLDCFVIPTVLLLSWIFLRVRYKLLHFVGVGVCLLGVGALVLADYLVSRYTGDAQNKLLGDFLCLAGATLYGISNVGQEYVVKNFDRVEYLGMIGFFGSFINGVQFAVLERREVADIDISHYQTALALAGFVCCLFLLYSLMPVVISRTSATAVNLNLLSADFYALLVGIFIFHYKFHVLYFISFAFIIVGLVLYSVKSPPTDVQQEYRVVQTTNSAASSKHSTDTDLPALGGKPLVTEEDLLNPNSNTKTGANPIASESTFAIETEGDNSIRVHIGEDRVSNCNESDKSSAHINKLQLSTSEENIDTHNEDVSTTQGQEQISDQVSV